MTGALSDQTTTNQSINQSIIYCKTIHQFTMKCHSVSPCFPIIKWTTDPLVILFSWCFLSHTVTKSLQCRVGLALDEKWSITTYQATNHSMIRLQNLLRWMSTDQSINHVIPSCCVMYAINIMLMLSCLIVYFIIQTNRSGTSLNHSTAEGNQSSQSINQSIVQYPAHQSISWALFISLLVKCSFYSTTCWCSRVVVDVCISVLLAKRDELLSKISRTMVWLVNR